MSDAAVGWFAESTFVMCVVAVFHAAAVTDTAHVVGDQFCGQCAQMNFCMAHLVELAWMEPTALIENDR